MKLSIQMSLSLTTSNVCGSVFITSVIFLADGRHIVGVDFDGRIRRWRVDDGQEAGKPINVGDIQIDSLAASRDGKWIVSRAANGRVTVWNAETHSKVSRFKAHSDFPVEAVDVSPDGTRIATGSHDSTVCVWSLSTGKRLLGLLRYNNVLAAVKYSLNGRLLATATCGRHSVRIYDSECGRLLIDVPVKVDAYNKSLAWSNDCKRLYALSDGNIMCLDVSTGKTLSEWPIHSNDDPRGVILAKNGRFIAASANTTLSFWDATTEKQIGPIIERIDVVSSMDISPNYDLVTSGVDSAIVQSLRGILPSPYCDNVGTSALRALSPN